MTYEIKNLSDLESNVSSLATINQKVNDNATSLDYIINEIRTHWENESGSDLQSILEEIENCVSSLRDAIVPTNKKYVETMNKLIAETRSHQSQTM